MEEIKSTIIKWNTIYTKISGFNQKSSPLYTNVLEVVKNINEYANDIIVNRKNFNSILNQYLSENRAEIWLRFWIEHVNLYNPSPMNSSFDYEWTTRLLNIDPKYDVSYENAQTMMKLMKSRRDMSHCDDPVILAIHEGRECEGNGWFCWHCDDMESKWADKLLKDLKLTNNVFLNPILKNEFIEYAKDIVVIPASWTPPIDYTSYNEHLEPEYKSGWTTIQCIKVIVDNDYKWRPLYKLRTDSHYSIFISMWPFIKTVPPVLEIIVNKITSLIYGTQ